MKLELKHPPKRIISLVPSQTELLFVLGLSEEVIGITKFCIHPSEWFHTKTRIGGTKTVNIELVKSLKPDLIIANKEENTKEDIEQLRLIAPLWMSDIFTLEDALAMIQSIGDLTGKEANALSLINQISANFSQLPKLDNHPLKKGAYFIWRDPYMVAGKNTFIDDMLKYCGLENCTFEERYPFWDSTNEIVPEIILLSSEPYPFKQKHIEELEEMYPDAKVLLVDGELFSWYGSRLIHSPNYFTELKKIIFEVEE